MITATASPATTLLTTNLTPAIDSSMTVSPTVTGAPVLEGFSTALTAQLNLLAQPSMNVAMLTAPTPAMLSGSATTATMTAPVVTSELAPTLTNTALEIIAPTLPQNTVNVTNAQLMTIAENTPVTTDEATMSAKDTAILSTVTDTLKFITAGAKLGDTLPTANSAILSAQKSMQAATQPQTPVVMAAAIETPVLTTPAQSVVAQSQTPVVIAASIETPVVTTPVQTAVAQPQTPVVTTLVQTAVAQPQTPVVIATPLETPVVTTLVQTAVAQPQKPVVTTPVQTAVAQPQTSVVIAARIETPVVTTPIQTAVAQPQTPVVIAAPLETPVATMPVQAAAQPQTPVAAPVQTPTIEPTTLVQVEAQKTPVNSVVAEPIAAPISQNETVPIQQNNAAQKTVATISTPEEAIAIVESTPATTNATPLLTKTKNISVKEISSDSISAASEQDSPADNQNAVITQIMPNAIIVPQVAAPATSTSVQPKIENVATETSSDTTAQDKLTLTSASTLLKEAVANRSNTNGDAANSGNNGSGNAPQNTALLDNTTATSLTDSKQSAADLKSFASLLTAEKTDIIGVTATDKTTPQVVTAAVNKLVQDTKTDVPAMTKPLSHPEWNQDLGERIVWMNNRGISSAEIRMNPQNMGPITVRIDINQDQATIAFTAQNSDVRTALEASIPKLREMLNSQQLNLADVKVSQQPSTSADSGRSQQQATQTADASTSGQSNRQNNPELDAQGNLRQVNASGDEIMVDEFANGQVLNMNGTNGLLSVHA